MKNKHVILCILGSSVAILGVCIYVIWKRQRNGERKIETDKIRKKKSCPRRLSYHVDNGDGLLSGEEIKASTIACITSGTNPEILTREVIDQQNHVEQNDQSETSLSSMTGYDDDSSNASGEKANYLTDDSSSTSETSIAGVLDESTYRKMQEKIKLPDEIDDLTGSPVVVNFVTDTRYNNLQEKDDVPRTPSNVVVKYEGDVTPFNVNENIQNVSETYSSIVPPLQPNTGTVVSTDV